jgi:CheY-like chemotaxis protein
MINARILFPEDHIGRRTRRLPCILCVDDEHPDLELRKALLESAGYRVLATSSGREAIRLSESEPVDAVVLDYWMADMNGLAVARELKRRRPKLPIIMLTAFFMFPEETIGVVDCCLGKADIEPNDLLKALSAALDGSRNRRNRFRATAP